MKKLFLYLAISVVFLFFDSSCSMSKADYPTNSARIDSNKILANVPIEETSVEVGGAKMLSTKNIFENIINSKDHTTLIAAVKQAGLVELLSGDDLFTIFAPTNQAFLEVPKARLDSLMKPEMKADLTSALTYHIVLGALKTTDLMDGKELTTIQGGKLKVVVRNGRITINNANITFSDVVSSNGIAHVIDGVLMPK